MQDGVLRKDVKLEFVARSYLTSDWWKRSRGIKSKEETSWFVSCPGDNCIRHLPCNYPGISGLGSNRPGHMRAAYNNSSELRLNLQMKVSYLIVCLIEIFICSVTLEKAYSGVG